MFHMTGNLGRVRRTSALMVTGAWWVEMGRFLSLNLGNCRFFLLKSIKKIGSERQIFHSDNILKSALFKI